MSQGFLQAEGKWNRSGTCIYIKNGRTPKKESIKVKLNLVFLIFN